MVLIKREILTQWQSLVHKVLLLKIFQLSAAKEMGKKSKLVKFSTQELYQSYACMISTRKAKHLDITTMFAYSLANMSLGQSECAYYLSYFTNAN